MYWRLTQQELLEVFRQVAQRDKLADVRAAMICCTIINTNPYRKKGARVITPGEFLRGAPKHMSVEEAEKFLKVWTKGINAQFPKSKK